MGAINPAHIPISATVIDSTTAMLIEMLIEKDKNLKEFTTFKIGGPAQFFCSVKNEADLVTAVAYAKEHKLEIFILGGGSNILIRDKGFAGLVIKMEIMGMKFAEGIESVEGNDGITRATVLAGESWDGFVREVVARGLFGVETLSYIPGTVGAAPVQNIGAYGSEVKDTVESVRVFDIVENTFKDFSHTQCEFEYRSSIFKREVGRYIIVSVVFALKKNGKVSIAYKDLKEFFTQKGNTEPTLAEVRDAVIEIRTRKLPDVALVGTAGSFFKNPIITREHADTLKKGYADLPVYPVDESFVKVSLAWVIDHICNYKGISKGNVGTYKNQALVLVNNGDATAAEIISFAEEIKKVVKEKTNIDAEFEVQII